MTRLSDLSTPNKVIIANIATGNGAAKDDLSNVLNATFLAKATSAGVGGGGSSSKVYIDPHASPYNAKGDGVVVKNGQVASGELDRFSTSHYTFTSADIGKKVWCQDIGATRTITSVSAGKAVVDTSFPSWFPSQGAGLVIQFGTDDTAALQAALNAAQDFQANISEYTGSTETGTTWIPGATVQLRSGCTYIVENSSTSWNGGAGKKSALIIPRKVGLLGGGKNATKIAASLAHYGHVLATNISQDLLRTLPHVDGVELGNFNLVCHGDINGNVRDGIHFASQFSNFANVDAFNYLHDLFIQAPGRDGLYSEGRGESVYVDINVQDAIRYGVHFRDHPDYMAIRVSAGGCNKTGIKIIKARSGNWMSCKSYFNGKDPTTVDGDYTDETGQTQKAQSLEANSANWHVYADYDFGGCTTFTGCEAQESTGSSWVIESGELILNSCTAVDPGRTSYGPTSGSRPSVITGFHLKGVYCHNVVFANSFVKSELGVSDTQNFGYANSAVYVEGVDGSNRGPQKCKGTIWTMESLVKSDGTTWTPNFNAGSKLAGAGISNGKNVKLSVDGVALT